MTDVQSIHASSGAFAAILGNGDAVTWGVPSCGGDSRSVKMLLKDVRQIQAPQTCPAPVSVVRIVLYDAVRKSPAWQRIHTATGHAVCFRRNSR